MNINMFSLRICECHVGNVRHSHFLTLMSVRKSHLTKTKERTQWKTRTRKQFAIDVIWRIFLDLFAIQCKYLEAFVTYLIVQIRKHE